LSYGCILAGQASPDGCIELIHPEWFVDKIVCAGVITEIAAQIGLK
jgi:hypothetical protein